MKLNRINIVQGLLACVLASVPAFAEAQQFWNTNNSTATWTNANWGASGAGPFTTAWSSGSDVRFTANSLATFATTTVGNVTVDPGVTVTVTAGGTLSFTGGTVKTWDIGAGSTLAWTSQTMTATSAAGITKNGTGTLNLNALTFATNMTGGFTLNNGTVIVTGSSALGNGALTLNGGTLQSSGTRAFLPTSIVIGGDFALAGTGNANWDAATTIALGSSTRTITNSTTGGGNTRQFRGLISGSAGAGLTFTGNGTAPIYIGNTGNTFTGPVAITGSEVVFNDNGAFGATTSITLDGGRLTMASMDTAGATSPLTTATIGSSRTISVGDTAGTSISISGATGVTSYDGVIADVSGKTGAWAKQGGGMLRLGGVSTYTGATAINNGTLQLTTGNDRLPTGTVVSLGQGNSTNLGTFDLNGRNQQVAGLNSTTGTSSNATLNNTITSVAAATLTLGGNGTYAYGDGTNANSGVITGAISLVKSGSGTQTLGDTNTYTGGTTVSGGTLVLGNATDTLANSGAVLVSGGTLSIGSNSDTVGAVTLSSGSITGSSGVLTGASYAVQSGSVSAILGGSGIALTKSTGGTVTLSGVNTYNGATTVNAGTLAVTGAGSINNTSAVNVAAGGRFAYNSSVALSVAPTLNGSGTGSRAVYGGTGTLNAALTLDNVGDVLSPGNSPGIQTYGVNQSWASNSYDWELNDWTASVAGTNIDQIAITGNLTLTGAAPGSYILNVLSLTSGNVTGLVPNFSDVNNSWTILTTTTGISGFNSSFWTVDTTGFTSSPTATGSWNVAQIGNNLVLNYVAVPEPSTLALLGVSVVGLAVYAKRRRSSKK